LITGKGTLRIFSNSTPDFRASWSAPPPGPQGTTYSMARAGYLSCAVAEPMSEPNITAAAAKKVKHTTEFLSNLFIPYLL